MFAMIGTPVRAVSFNVFGMVAAWLCVFICCGSQMQPQRHFYLHCACGRSCFKHVGMLLCTRARQCVFASFQYLSAAHAAKCLAVRIVLLEHFRLECVL